VPEEAALKHEVITPKWRVDLRPAIGDTPLGLVVGHGHETKGRPHTSLWFLDDKTIVVTFVIREDKPNLSTHDDPELGSPLRLRAIFLDVTTGKILATQTWPTGSAFAHIVATHDRKFVTQRGTALTLYSPDYKELKKIGLPVLEGTNWTPHPSPTGRNILFIATNLRATSTVPWIWVDTDSLQIIRSWEEIQSGWVGISDDKIAMTTCVWMYDCKPDVKIRGLDTKWETVAPAAADRKPQPQFIDDDRLFLPGQGLVRADGKVLFTQKASTGGCWWSRAVPATSGKRFVFPSCTQKGVNSFLDLEGYSVLKKILLSDKSFLGWSYELEVRGPIIRDLFELAISPDSLQLAILNDQSLEVFQLPNL
jgi:hypothetical protein